VIVGGDDDDDDDDDNAYSVSKPSEEYSIDVCDCLVTLSVSGLRRIRILKSGTDLCNCYCHV
jgi:hypothetical protein